MFSKNGVQIQKEIRAVLSSYIALDGIWIVLAVAYIFASIKSPGKSWEIGAVILAICSILWALWLRGFKLTVTDKYLEYRDGFYRISKISLEDVKEMKHKWVQWKNLGWTLSIPRIAVITKDRKTAFLINDKPFGINDLAMIRNMVKEANQSKEQR